MDASFDAPLDSPLWHQVAALRPRLRPHVRVQRRHARGEDWILLTDARSGRFHRVHRSTYELVGRLDGRHSLDVLWHHVHDALGAEAPTQGEVLQLLAQLRAADLVSIDSTPDFELTRQRQERAQRRRRLAAVNPLAFRIPLFDPSPWLDALAPLGRAVFSTTGLIVWLLLVVGAGAMALQAHEPLARAFAEQATSTGVLWTMWIAYPLVKLLHELGHGLALRAWGGRVRQFGLTLMVLTPVPYVDASAATGLASRRRRVAVGAAGIAVELALAALAFLVWQAASDARVQQIGLAVMMLCGLSTLLFNGNPLVRFDGYHMLCDALDLPNLGARAQAELHALLGRAIGLPAPLMGVEPASTRQRLALLAYALASAIYRVAIGLGVVFFLHSEHPLLALVAALFLLGQQLVWPAWGVLRFLTLDVRLDGRRGRAWGVSAAMLLALLLGLAGWPVRQVTVQQGLVWLPEQAVLRAGTAGELQAVLSTRGAEVRPGQAVVRLRNAELEEERLDTLARRTRVDVNLYQALLSNPPEAARLQTERDALDAQLARQQQRDDELLLRAQIAGTLVLPRLAQDPGQYVHQGEAVGYVVAPEPPLVKLALNEAQAALLREGVRQVEVRLVNTPGTVWAAQIERETPGVARQLPHALLGSSQGGPIPTDPADPHGLQTLQPIATVDIRLPREAQAPLGLRAWVRIEHAPRPLVLQGWEALRQLFLRSLGAQA